MGDRGQIGVRLHDGSEIYLYTHWEGSEIFETCQRSLRKEWRWDDGAYLARIIFDDLVGGERGTETGFGISTYIMGPEHQIPLVDTNTGIVHVLDENGVPTGEWYFIRDFIKLPPEKISELSMVLNG